jgi:hypothetical protein
VSIELGVRDNTNVVYFLSESVDADKFDSYSNVLGQIARSFHVPNNVCTGLECTGEGKYPS